MIFENYTIPEPFEGLIESIFHLKNFNPDHSIERVVPTGHVFLIFELDGMVRNTFDNITLKPNGHYSEVWLSGMHRNYLSISAHQNSEMLVVQFTPIGGYPFIHSPLHKFNDKVLPAQEVFGDEILELREAIQMTETSKEKFKKVETWLKIRYRSEKLPSHNLLSIIEELRLDPLSDHGKIIDSYSKTQKNLIDQFKKYCGHTPKVLHRIFRFNELLQKIRNEEKIAWSQIAYQFGYSDQSHFIKEFKEFSGFNPQEFIERELNKGEPNFFPLDKKG